MKKSTQSLLARGPLVVGTVHSLASLRLAATLKPGEVDVLEYRLDALTDQLSALAVTMEKRKIPWLVTVRHPAEGGVSKLSSGERKDLYRFFLQHADLVDIELRSLPDFEDILEEARQAGCGIVISNHDFKKTPPVVDLIARQKRAFAAGADIFKIACATPTARELAKLLEFSARPTKGLRSIMGMGRFGKASRLVLAEAGSVLNYGYLHQPNAPGQWEARELRRVLNAPA